MRTRKEIVNMKTLISRNKMEILLDKEAMDRIEKKIDEKHNKQLKVKK